MQNKYGETLHSPLPVLYFTIHHCHTRAHGRRHNSRRNNPCRVHTSILTSVRNHIHWYQLQGRNIQNQKCAHLITRNSLPLSPFLFHGRKSTLRFSGVFAVSLQIRRIPPLLLQLLHRLQPALCQVNDTNILITFLKPSIR